MERFDLVVVGAGPGGYVAAIRAAQLGLRAAVVERERAGGVCGNWGCIPSKAILDSAELFAEMRRAGEHGVVADGVRLDYPRVIARSREAARRVGKGVESLLRRRGIPLYSGTARLEGRGAVLVSPASGGEPLRLGADRVLLASGSAEQTLPGLEVDGRTVLTSREALAQEDLPTSIVVIGGGAVGVELAYAYDAFGARVTLVEMEAQLLPGMDAELGRELGRLLARGGMDVLVGHRFASLARGAEGCEVTLEGSGGQKVVRAEKVLVAVGRRPLSEGLGLEEVGVRTDRGFIVVDGQQRTSCEWVYAVGDVAGPPLLAHKASEEGIAAVEFMVGQRERPVDRTRIPVCIYCQPEVAAVGLTEAQALAQGHDVAVGRFPFRALGKAAATGHQDGFVKLVADRRYGEILGCHLIGRGATELVAEVGLARALEATVPDVASAVHAHPTFSEAIGEAALAIEGRAINV